MKKVLLLIFIGLGITCGQIKAQDTKYIFPQYKECVGYYSASPSGGALYYNYVDIKVKPNSTMMFNVSSAAFWNDCTDFIWVFNLPGTTAEIYERDCRIELGSGIGHAMFTINATDKNGYRRSCSFMFEVKN